MSAAVPAQVRRILAEGDFCHVVAATPLGPHVTPMVFATAGDRVWVTTSRGSVKARAWRTDARVGGMVRAGERVVCFTGSATTYDVLDAGSWGRSIRAAVLLGLAGARFTRKNARFFAGYAVDAHHVPFAWTPPGRVFAELTIDRSVVLEDAVVTSVWGEWDAQVGSVDRFRATRAPGSPLELLPPEVVAELGDSGAGALGLATPEGPVVLPARWFAGGGAIYAALSEEVLALTGAGSTVPVALQVDRASWWRARAMLGAMVRGRAEVAVPERLASGATSATSIARRTGADPTGAAVLRIRPERLVWWRGWSSGSVVAP